MTAKNPFLYTDWIEDFQREVEDQIRQIGKTLQKRPRADPEAAVRDASRGFDDWWTAEQQDLMEPPPSMRDLDVMKELDVSRKEVAALTAELGRLKNADEPAARSEAEQDLRRLTSERDALKAEAEKLKQAAAANRDAQAALENQVAALRRRLAQERIDHASRLRLLQDHLDDATARRSSLEADLRAQRDLRAAAEHALREHDRRAGEVDALRSELSGLKSDIETKMQASIEFLEMKLRSVQDQNKGQAHQLRELLEALQRLRSRNP